MTLAAVVETHSRGETQVVAAAMARVLRAGDVVVLSGDLGGGKTTFVAGAVPALGSDAPVSSPTFALVHEYPAPVPVAHIDVYRLHRVQDLHDIGADEILDGGQIVFVEWGDLVSAALPAERLVVRFDLGTGPDDRLLGFEAHGEQWSRRWPDLVEALGATGATMR
jgi:tRNA threonylcarbamoyladenosine biosynthesis protein TsaE